MVSKQGHMSLCEIIVWDSENAQINPVDQFEAG